MGRAVLKPRNAHIGGIQAPLFTPDSSWVVPSELPDLRGMGITAWDTETNDEGLRAGRGPGWAYGSGYIAGISTSWREGGELRSVYVPLRHPDTECFDRDAVRRWVADHWKAPVRKVFQNAPYDLGWALADLGVAPPDATYIDDTTAMAVMLDENRFSYQLNDLAKWRGVPGKDETLLREAAAAYGYHGGDVKANLFRMPARYVGQYAELDASSPLQLYESMLPDLQRDGVEAAYRLECDLIPMVLEMRRRGIRVDIEGAERAKEALIKKRDDIIAEIARKLGERVSQSDLRSTKWLERVHDAASIQYPRTAKTRTGSFTAGKNGWMGKHPHWLPQLIAQADKYQEASSKFIQGYILDYAHRGRIHASINQFLGEDENGARRGTRSHRFSYSDPALQQMPERDPEMGPLIRGLFLPEEGQLWGAHDYSQQEYRMIVHYAYLLGCRRSAEAVRLYQEDPNTDFHALVVDWTGLERRRAKDTNFAKAFGAGVPKFALMIERPEEEARAIYEQYDEKLPFVSEAARIAMQKAAARGYIILIDGARCHFDMWEPSDWDKRSGPPMSQAAARAKWPGIRLTRAMTHKAFNRLIQGSAARQTKLAMRECWRQGLVPMLQMHDDLNFSHSEERTALLVGEIMRDIIKLEVPVKVDNEFGPTWGQAKSKDFGGAMRGLLAAA